LRVATLVHVPYRDSLPAPANPREEAAISTLASRAQAVRAFIILVHIAVGVALGSVLYSLLGDWFLEHRGGYSPYVNGVISFVPTFGAMLRLAPHVVRLVMKALLPRWQKSLATKYGLDPAAFAELTALLVR
jgi:hypothetical protein